MGTFSWAHWLVLLLCIAVLVIPIGKMLKRVGFTPWLAILFVIPLVSLITLWVFAFIQWPRDKRADQAF